LSGLSTAGELTCSRLENSCFTTIYKICLQILQAYFIDCSKAGQFQSITSQFSRSRQSRQFSFQGDSHHTQLQNDRPRQAVQHEYDRTVYDDQIKIFNNHIQQFDGRIDNMEATVSGLSDSMTFMEKKVCSFICINVF
jgi:hypothetical protein